jgi:hypothetical protein
MATSLYQWLAIANLTLKHDLKLKKKYQTQGYLEGGTCVIYTLAIIIICL